MNQLNYFNYAQHLEQLKYQSVNESALILEADASPDKALGQVKSGAKGGAFAPQWKQLADAISTAVDAAAKAGTVMVKHDNGTDMVSIKWSTDAQNQVSLSVAGSEAADKADSKSYPDSTIQPDVSDLVRMLDPLNPVYGDELDKMYGIISKYIGKLGLRDDDTTTCDAVGRLMLLYKRDESGDTLTNDIDKIGSTTFTPENQKKLTKLKGLVKPYTGKEDSFA